MTPSNIIRRRYIYWFLSILFLFLLGTVVVLSSITYYLAIDPRAYLAEFEVPILDNTTRWNASEHGMVEVIPRIIHQTWKTDVLPPKWVNVSQGCRDMMPDYEYKLWTDDGSREFLAEHYPWFLDTFDGYTYPIQRADAIRYFILYHFGGIYVDLDIGCLKPMDPLLIHSVILPKTLPVGVSNDLMFSVKRHPFFAQTIHNLITFDHSWVLNYPTVMFSTGPMFLSIQYGLFTSSRAFSGMGASSIRILSQAFYGKNAKEGEAPNSFFSHFYGSSWHADDAAFISFLGSWGKGLMWVGLAVLIFGVVRLATGQRRKTYNLLGGYDVRWSQRSQRWYHPRTPSTGDFTESTQYSSPAESECGSPIDHPVLELPTSPLLEAQDYPHAGASPMRPIFDAVRRVRNRISEAAAPREETPRTPARIHFSNHSNRGVLYFLPAIFTQRAPEFGLPHQPHRPTPHAPVPTASASPFSYAETQTLVDISDDAPRPEPRSRSSRGSPAPLL